MNYIFFLSAGIIALALIFSAAVQIAHESALEQVRIAYTHTPPTSDAKKH